MIHQNGRKKLNLKAPHKRALMRNQAIHLIKYGHLVSTKARVKETKRFIERAVTIAREGNTFNARRRVTALLPYDTAAVIKLFKEIAPQYVSRPGGYTRIIPMGKRMSDTATIARLEWV
ncbi:MAG TPA: 50S ribosomal protein L17 [Candidatus Babeliales bacterium]|jgi:large subunit ribosomal protein L17|nr:50S ribosomal protein L17 [Candidatus Babeliales bacterium]